MANAFGVGNDLIQPVVNVRDVVVEVIEKSDLFQEIVGNSFIGEDTWCRT